MSQLRKLAASISLVLCVAAPAAAGSTSGSSASWDGSWSVSIVTDKGDCEGKTLTLVVAGNRLKQIAEIPLAASGEIDAHGQARFQVASMVTANGQMHGATGAGRWDAPSQSCSGRWRAAKI